MKIKLTKKVLQEIGIHNPHNLCSTGGGRIYVGYSPDIRGRASSCAKWQVIGVRENTDPSTAWYNYGCKTFTVGGTSRMTHAQSKEQERQAAIEWATKKYGITEWAKDVFGDYQEAAVIERVKEILQNRINEGKK